MKTSAIRHPEHSYFIRRHDWQLQALAVVNEGKVKRTEIPECGSEILSIFEYHYNNKFANRILRQLIEHASARDPVSKLKDVGDWLPYSLTYLKELTLGSRGSHVITESLLGLESIGFISSNVPADITECYSRNMKWYRLNVAFINEWIDSNIEKSWLVEKTATVTMFGSRSADEVPLKSTGKRGKHADPETSDVALICQFHKHIHAKTNGFVYDSKRKRAVANILKQPDRTLGMAAQAIIGNLFSDWHQGKHDNNLFAHGGKIYDDIELMFRNAGNFEKHIAYAESAKITEGMALAELKAFEAGEPSKYAKAPAKASQTATIEKPQGIAVLPVDEQKRYRDFGRTVAGFFASAVTNENIMELCREHGELKSAGAGLKDAGALTDAILTSVATFRPRGVDADLKLQIQRFSKSFAKFQSINS